MDWPIVTLILGAYLISVGVVLHVIDKKNASIDVDKLMADFSSRLSNVELNHTEVHKLSKETQKLLSETQLAKSLRPGR